MMCASIAMARGIGRGSVHNSPPTQVLQRSRRLSKDEMILRLGDGKAVAAEAVGSLHLDKEVGRLKESRNRQFGSPTNLRVLSEGKKMTKKPFVGQSAITNSLLDLVHTDVCGPLSIPARGGFSYFITFTDDHSRYGYVYLMRYKSEAFGRFKEYRLEVENQSNRKIKALRSDRGSEYLSGEFIDYLKENGILSQWTPPGTPQLNGVAERMNRTLLDMVRSMMSFTELPPSFWGYALETAAKLLNIAPSKSVPQTPYEIWHGKPASYKYLRVWGSPAYVKRLVGDKLDSRSSLCSRRDEVLIEESSGEPQHDSTTSFEPTVHTDSAPVVRRLVAKGYTQRPGVDFEETYSPVAMAKSIRILLAIAAWYDYEIWQMDVKMAFLNGYVEEDIFMDQPEGFTVVGEEQKVCHLQRSIYGLKQASRSWNTRFDEVIRVMISSRTTMILVYTRRSVGARLHTLCFMSMTSYSLETMLRC
ncbi:UNVERIFIED_CONTAM: Retrovirus-related Pol polyprotein from transposon TNT 1-94 [Sesamum radiatum]|uniref:Retrovirus-related Pol polyprotein from transposon TNT 1-94 n=1 Tax=Sesamum radiatum TaxID=300843 RepID=A0AAW2IWS6_SESRA